MMLFSDTTASRQHPSFKDNPQIQNAEVGKKKESTDGKKDPS
jgi:hypothetical protein